MSIKLKSIFSLAFIMMAGLAFSQSDRAFIYGTVSTIDGQKFKGQIRWDDEEAFWDDIFNSTKTENPYNRWTEKKGGGSIRFNSDNEEWNFMALWKDNQCCEFHFGTHQFAIRFGDIKALEMTDRSSLTVHFKDGQKTNISGGSNDVGANIQVLDPELGLMEVRWERINRIDFEETPDKLEKRIGAPLYGKLTSIRGSFEGLIQWDHEECLSIDKLDGSNNNGKLAIEMGNIRKIERFGRGSKVTLKSGREVELYNSNDVNSSNRGVVVKDVDYGKILVEWSDFESVEFIDTYSKSKLKGYNDYQKPKRIQGEVETVSDKKISGLIAYDLDETFDYELLDGNDYEVKYNIPFRDIESIMPKNYNFSTVTLKSGKSVLLGGSQDVSDRNDGMMIFKTEKDEEPIFVPWKEIKIIKLQ